jgi:carbon monoxide dehydrogenase subunit G
MESTYESKIKVALNSASSIYNRVSDFNNFSAFIPNEKIKDVRCTTDTCHFTVDKIGEVGLRIIDREPCKTVKFTADGATRFNFYLWIQLKEVAPYESRIKVTLKADLNPMMKMLAGKQLQKFVDMLADGISKA